MGSKQDFIMIIEKHLAAKTILHIYRIFVTKNRGLNEGH